ncbi:MAG: substrate-binding domain-containing protein [Spirochaetes bacterium]|nr:substrate-binding domain-containing protein [Spirochaetota bacterium]
MRKKLLCSLIALVLLGFAVPIAFASSEEKAPEKVVGGKMSKYLPDQIGEIPVPSKRWRIGCLEKTLINDFWLDMKNGYEDAEKEYGVDIDIYAAPSEADILIQKQILDDMIAKNYDLICVSPITDTNILAALKTATQRNIPIINVMDAYISPEAQKKHGIKIASFVTTDFAENSRLATRFVAEKLGKEGGEIMHIMGLPGGRAAEERKRGYLEEVAKYPQLKNIGVWPGDWDRKKSMDIAADVIQSHPNLRAIIGANDTTGLGAYQAVKNAGKTNQILVAGIDAIPDAIRSVMNDELVCTVPFMQYQSAYIAIESAIQILEGKFDPANREIWVYQEVWHKGNIKDKVAEYKEQFSGLKDF